MDTQIDMTNRDLDSLTEQDMFALSQRLNAIEPSTTDNNSSFLSDMLGFADSNETMLIIAAGTIAAISLFYALRKTDIFSHFQSH